MCNYQMLKIFQLIEQNMPPTTLLTLYITVELNVILNMLN